MAEQKDGGAGKEEKGQKKDYRKERGRERTEKEAMAGKTDIERI